MLLNTSLNNHAEPIVNDAHHAMSTFLTTHLHYLCVGNFLLRKTSEVSPEDLIPLHLDLPNHRRLIVAPGHDAELHPTPKTPATRPAPVAIAPALCRLLTTTDARRPLGARLKACGLDRPDTPTILMEISLLWRNRALHLAPEIGD